MDITALFVFLFGLAVGSFLNVCIYRLPRGESIAWPPSHCTACGIFLKSYDLLPVLSYVLLRGKCRYCAQKISPRYMFVELLTAALFSWNYYLFGLSGDFVRASVMASFLLVIAWIDFDMQMIYDKVLIWFFAAGLWAAFSAMQVVHLIGGFLTGGLLLLALAVISRGGMGGGDIKLAAVLGVWLGWPKILLALFIAFIAGGIISAILLLLRLKKRTDMIPFGPFIALGGYLAFTMGKQIIHWYIAGCFTF